MTEEEGRENKNRDDSDDDDEVEKVVPEEVPTVGRGKRKQRQYRRQHLFSSFIYLLLIERPTDV